MWNTPEGGPCVLRPVQPSCPDNPHWNDLQTTLSSSCWSYIDKKTGDPKDPGEPSIGNDKKGVNINVCLFISMNLLQIGPKFCWSDRNPGE